MKMQIPSGYGGCSIRVQGRNRCTAQGKAHQGYSSWNTNGGSKHGKVLLLDQCSHEDFSPVECTQSAIKQVPTKFFRASIKLSEAELSQACLLPLE